MDVLDQLLERARVRQILPDPQIRRLLRTRAGLSQADVANALGVGRVAVTRYESGQRTPRGELAERYVRLLERLAREEVTRTNGGR
jgi:HTH-type transcriptional regulator/antitoxin MqsA